MDTYDQGQTPSRIGQWQQIKDLPEEVISEIKSHFDEKHFSLEVRDFLPEWIEEQPWSSVHDEPTAKLLLNEMVTKIKKCAGNQPFSTQHNLKTAAKKIQEHYGNDALTFVHIIENILVSEQSYLEQNRRQAENDPSQETIQQTDWTEYLGNLGNLSKEIQLKIHEAMRLDASSKDKMDEILKEAYESLQTIYVNLVNIANEILDKDLKSWIRKQRLYGNPKETDEIDAIQKWCSQIVLLIRDGKRQIVEINQLKINDPKLDMFTPLLIDFRRRIFIISVQPEQIITNYSYMNITVCLLCSEALNVCGKLSDVTATLSSVSDESKYSLTKNISPMQLLHNQYRAFFKTKLKRKTSSEHGTKSKKCKSSNEVMCVTEEKLVLKFSMTIQEEGHKEVLQVDSLPIVVMSHVSQVVKASGTILWHNYLTDYIQPEQNIPDKVSWKQFTEMLNYIFMKDVGVPLKPEHFKYFAWKIFDPTFGDTSSEYVTWNQFWKRTMKDKKFAFWDWFCSCKKLIEIHCCDMYKDNLIMGFIERAEAEKMLMQTEKGTFLFRFSDNRLGISVAVKDTDCVEHQMPLTSGDLKTETLANKVLGQKKLLYLYPDKLKKEALKQYAKKKPRDPDMEKLGYKPIGSDSDNEESSSGTPSPQSIGSHEQMDIESFNTYGTNILDVSAISIPQDLPENIFAGDSNVQNWFTAQETFHTME